MGTLFLSADGKPQKRRTILNKTGHSGKNLQPSNVSHGLIAERWTQWERKGMKTVLPLADGSCSAGDDFLRERRGTTKGLKSRAQASVALYVLPEYRDLVFSPTLVSEIGEIAGSPAVWVDPGQSFLGRQILKEAEILFCSWGTPRMDAPFLDALPNLKAVFYAAGAPGYFLTREFFDRGVTVTCAQAANAIPVIEFSTSVILLSLKRVWACMRETHQSRSWNKPERIVAGAYHSTVGLVSLGAIGRGVAKTLAGHDLKVLAYDPFVTERQAEECGAELVSLERLFSESDVVSLHAPLMPATTGLIGADLLDRMKMRATLVNTARGAIVRQAEMCEVLRRRPDLSAVLDVTDPEPPEFDSPLWDLPNVFLTPHSSGSLGGECLRMARFMVDEFRRYACGIPLLHQVTRGDWQKMV